MNETAFNELINMEKDYLIASGWEKSGKHWVIPDFMGIFFGDKLFHHAAVEMQKEYDIEIFGAKVNC